MGGDLDTDKYLMADHSFMAEKAPLVVKAEEGERQLPQGGAYEKQVSASTMPTGANDSAGQPLMPDFPVLPTTMKKPQEAVPKPPPAAKA